MSASTVTRDDLEGRLEEHRVELRAYCYRMLASPFEAEDAVQEVLVRAWRAFDRFEGRASLGCIGSPPTSVWTCSGAPSGGPARWTSVRRASRSRRT